MLPFVATIGSTLLSFQYKMLIKVIFLNKKLYTFGITNTVLCSFYSFLEEIAMHIFYGCIHL